MKKGMIGKKLGMTQIIEENGNVIPVTVIEVGPCKVIQIKNNEVDGYEAVQLGFVDLKKNHIRKPIEGHFKKAKVEPMKYLKEFKFDNISEMKLGDVLKADLFTAGDIVDIQGRSKGKGFAGVIKRYDQRRGRMSHGSGFHRRPGSIGASASPSRVIKGIEMPGHMGHVISTVQNLKVVKVDVEKNVILVKGSVPGAKGTILNIKMD